MDIKQTFAPTKAKLVSTISIVLVIFLFQFLSFSQCSDCTNISSQPWPELNPSCDCTSGQTLPEFLTEILTIFIIPFIATYIVYSLAIHFLKNKENAR
jgi:hypothetical protein